MAGHMASGRGSATSVCERFMRWPRRSGAKESSVARLKPSKKRAMRSILLLFLAIGDGVTTIFLPQVRDCIEYCFYMFFSLFMN